MKYTAIGLMSGSSLDGLDIAACTFDMDGDKVVGWALLQGETQPFPEVWQERLRRLPESDARSLALAHSELGRWMGQCVADFMQRHALRPNLVASHGHTIFHFPAEQFTTQIGDGAAIAVACGCPVVCDFRTGDMALGGQGAPLAPLADRMLFPDYDVLLNIGGIANITCKLGSRYVACDVGGANQILNALAQTLGLPYDDGGRIAATGQYIPALAEVMDALPYFSWPPPKSLGNDWVQAHQTQAYLNWPASVEDRLHTACRQLARQTARAIQRIFESEKQSRPAYRMLATGGGAYNTFLTNCIVEECTSLMGECVLELPDAGIVNYKEAVLMALMGVLRVLEIPNCIASATGAERDAVGGAVYLG